MKAAKDSEQIRLKLSQLERDYESAKLGLKQDDQSDLSKSINEDEQTVKYAYVIFRSMDGMNKVL
jgi:hypothetical protein